MELTQFDENYVQLRTITSKTTNYVHTTHHIINILPVIQGDELEGGEHRPEEIVEVRVTMVGVWSNAQTCVLRGTVPGAGQVSTDYRHFFIVYHPVGWITDPPKNGHT